MEFIDLKQIALMRVRGGFDHDWLCSNLPYMLSSNDVYRTLSSTTNCYTSSSQFLSSDDKTIPLKSIPGIIGNDRTTGDAPVIAKPSL